MSRAKFTIEVELEDEDSCERCPCLSWLHGCCAGHDVRTKTGSDAIRPDSCKANDLDNSC